MTGREFDVLGLPLELKRRVANFLQSRDAVSMARSCRALHDNLALTHLQPVRPVFTTFRRTGDPINGESWNRAFRLPVLNRRVHSMTLVCFWRGQGEGQQVHQGECRIVGYPASRSAEIPSRFAPGSQFEGGRVVASSPGTAQHNEERLKLTFSPVENEIYHLWYKVGAGNGHVLVLRAGELHTVIFDDEYRNFSNNYRILFEEGILCREVVGEGRRTPEPPGLFFPRMLISVSRSLRRELQAELEHNTPQRAISDDELEAFLAEYSIPLNLGSLVALEEIVQADIEERSIRWSEQQLQQQLPDEEVEEQPQIPRVFNIPLGFFPLGGNNNVINAADVEESTEEEDFVDEIEEEEAINAMDAEEEM